MISIVPCDEYTQMVQNNFDYTFTGESKFYPYELPKVLDNMDFDIMVISVFTVWHKDTGVLIFMP